MLTSRTPPGEDAQVPAPRHGDAGAHLERLRAEWLAGYASPNTRAAYARDLAAFLAWLDRSPAQRRTAASDRGDAATSAVFVATRADVERYRQQAAAELSAATVNRRLASLSSFFAHLVASAAVAANPVEAVERSPRSGAGTPDPLSSAQAAAVWAAALAAGTREAALIGLLLLDGLKLGETLSLGSDDVRAGAAGVQARLADRQGTRWLVLDPRSAASVVQLRRGQSAGPLFRAQGPSAGAPLSRFGADYLVKQVGLRARLPEPLTANQLRAAHVIAAHRAGEPVAAIRLRLGHAHVRTTLRLVGRDGT